MGGARPIAGQGVSSGLYGRGGAGTKRAPKFDPFTDAESQAAIRADPTIAPPPEDTTGKYLEILARQATERELRRASGRGSLFGVAGLLGGNEPYRRGSGG